MYIPPCRWDTGEEAAAGRAVQSVIAFPGQSWYDKHGAAQRPPPALSLFSRGSGGSAMEASVLTGAGRAPDPPPGKELQTMTETKRRELFPGVVCSRMEYRGNSYALISKSGGFGGPELLAQLQALTEER